MDEYSKLHENFKQWFTDNPLGLAKKTVEQYLFVVKSLLSYLSAFNIKTLNDISHDSFFRFIHIKPKNEPYAESSIIQRIAALDIFFSWANENKWIRENNNPVVYYKKTKIQAKRIDTNETKEPNSINVLTPEEQKIFVGNSKGNDFLSIRNHCIASLILCTGIYASEITTLTSDSINLVEGYLIVNKGTNAERNVRITDNSCKKSCQAWESIRKNLTDAAHTTRYFFTKKLKPLNSKRIYEIISKITSSSGIQKNQIGPDLLRQTSICNMVREGYSVEEIKNITGIKTSSYIEKYKALV